MEGLTSLQSFNGTPAFTAPEVYQHTWEPCEAKHVPDTEFAPELDLWSLGVISYYMLTGQLPFSWQRDLLAYQRGEMELPVALLERCKSSSEASLFIMAMLAVKPSARLPAREALDHLWLTPLQQDSEPEDQAHSPKPPEGPADIAQSTETNIFSTRMQSPEMLQARDVLLPGTINLATAHQSEAPEDKPPQLPLPFSQSLGFDGDTYKQIVRSQVSNASTTINDHPALQHTASIAQSQTRESQRSESNRPNHTRQISSIDMTSSPTDTLPPYTRRRSDAAPIPITDLNRPTPKPESTHSSIKSTDRLSKRIRRVSKDMVPKRTRRSQDSISTKDGEVPMSPTSTTRYFLSIIYIRY